MPCHWPFTGLVRVRGELLNHPEGDVYRGLLMQAWLLFDAVDCCFRLRPTGGSFWTNRAEARGQLVTISFANIATELSVGGSCTKFRVVSRETGPEARFALLFLFFLVIAAGGFSKQNQNTHTHTK